VIEPDLAEKLVQLQAALERADLPHAFGGAIALAYYAEPRATIDIDVNVLASPEEHERVAAALTSLGVQMSRSTDAAADGQLRCWWGRTPIDVFYSYDPFHDAMRAAVKLVPFGQIEIPILSVEHLIVCKVLFNRSRDWVDIEAILEGDRDVDRKEIGRWLDRFLAADDPRITRFEGLARR
jgi:hypothetical protein